MCGICGIFNYKKNAFVLERSLIKMNEALNHRGPDGEGIFLDSFIGLGHKRLSVIDVNNGSQPMCNEDGTIWISYNGEIYNYYILRKELVERGHIFKTNCDTEVIIHAYEEYGFACLERFNGMFAFALWDDKNERLFIARDRLGIKPLYYSYINNESIVFASEVKAILQNPSIKKDMNKSSVLEYIFCTTMIHDDTMFKNIKSLSPGHYLVIDQHNNNMVKYWDLTFNDAKKSNFNLHSGIEQIDYLLNDSVKSQLMSDVSFGTLLSGGIDSSIISVLANNYLNQTLSTFALEFVENKSVVGKRSDMDFARIVANQNSTNHHEIVINSEEYRNVLNDVTWHIEKPIELTTPSLFLLYKYLKKDVTVVLSGEGADELFGGYFFFLSNCRDQTKLTQYPWAPYFDEVFQTLNPSIKREIDIKQNINESLVSQYEKLDTDDHLNKILYFFIKHYLLEMLERQDKTSMAWGVESRVPFLDHRLVETVMNIPSNFKLNNDNEKFILKETFKNILPHEIVSRKKKPFPFPIDPKSIFNQRKTALEILSKDSMINEYFERGEICDLLNKRGKYKNLDSLAIFRTSYLIIALEKWFNVFNI